uniref:SOS response-associated peptidase n=1 Tax=Flavobacterium sp. TaxID=239 RepID=UPI0040498703
MCYHSKQTKEAKQVQNRFKAKIDNQTIFKPNAHFNGFEFPKIPIIIDENPEIITHFNWGLIPSWAKNDDIKKVTLNAKIETLTEKPSFKNSVHKRCLIIANGFYEWQWLDSKGTVKIKYEIGHPDEALFAFAGIYAQWTNSVSGVLENTCSIITTAANPLMSEIHNTKKRMPVILKKEDEANWLNHENLDKFTFPYQTDLVARKIDTFKNPQMSLF